MSPALTCGLFLLVSYLCGSIPFGLLIARGIGGRDLRHVGSGNIGATNAARVLGAKWGVLCLVFDFLKGLLPTLLLPWLVDWPDGWESAVVVGCAVAAILGHVFPVWLRFHGGKGVATGAGVALVVAPIAWCAAAVAFGVVVGLRRIVSLAALVASTVFALVVLGRHYDLTIGANWPPLLFGLGIPTLIFMRHRTNIRRLWRGEEKTLSARDEDPVDHRETNPTPDPKHQTTGESGED